MPNRPPDDFEDVLGKRSKNRHRNQEDPTPNPESTKRRYEGTHSRKETIRINGKGKPKTVRETKRGQDEDGNFEEHVFEDKEEGPGGMLISPEDIPAYSYTEIATPQELLVRCYNPWNNHGLRWCCKEEDGKQTDLGFWLCLDCKAENDELIRKHKRWWDFRDYDYC